MASVFYGVDVGGESPKDVTEGSSTGSKTVEVQVDLSKTTDKITVIKLLENLINYIKVRETNPVA